MAETTVHHFAPWAGRYSQDIDWNLKPPASPNLAALVSTTARAYARQQAFTCVMPNGMYGNLSFEETDRLSDDFAVYLREVLGIGPGKRVAVQMPNSLVTPVVVFGILKAGCVLVNVNPLCDAGEMQRQFKDSGAEALVICDLFTDKLADILPDTPVRDVLVASVSSLFPPLVRHVIQGIMRWWNRVVPPVAFGATRLEHALADGRRIREGRNVEVRQYWAGIAHGDLALLQYSAGTTGVAKGAMLSHGNLLWNVEQIAAMGRAGIVDGKEVVLTALPLYHIFAFTTNLLAFFRVGARNILVPDPRPIRKLQRAFENYPITWVSGVNTMYGALLHEEWFNVYPPRHLKAAIGGGAPMHPAIVRRWERLTNSRLLEGYGLTETSPLVCFQLVNGPPKTESIGIPAPRTEVRLLDEHGRPTAQGMPGELVVRGPQVMHGYWKLPHETAQVLRDGWLHTGDIAVMDEDFSFRIVDRKNDLITVSGLSVYPNEIEEVLSSHEKVMEAAVIGVPSAKTGEAVHAYVVKRDQSLDEAELERHCRRHLAVYKLPARFVFCDALPKSAVGKVLRRELRRQAMLERSRPAAAGAAPARNKPAKERA